MKITKKLIENVISEVVGVDVIPIIDYLKDKKNISGKSCIFYKKER